MASAARTFSRAFAQSAPATSSFRSAAQRTGRFSLPAQTFRASSRRGYSSEAGPEKSSNAFYWGLGAVAVGGAGAFYYLNDGNLTGAKTNTVFVPTKEDYQKVYDEIARLLVEKDEYDDGSYGPVCYPSLTALYRYIHI
jgi:cytochrome c peroxidase